MKKSLIALAVLAVSGASFAQSSVTLYGIADVWFGSTKIQNDAGSTRNTTLDSGGVDTSRWGVKGSEDLGGGLKANFKLEQGFNIDNGSAENSSAFSRQSWVGVSGGFGEVQLGQVWSSYDDVNSAATDTFNANVASKYNVWTGYQDNISNAIKYITPNMGGFSGSFTYGMGEDKNTIGDNKESRIMALGLQFANGPVVVGLAHQEQKQSGTNGIFSAFPVLPNTTGKATYTLLNGSYDFGVAKLIAGYNVAKQTIDGGGDFKAKEYDLGIDVPLSPAMTLAAGYARSKVDDLGKTTGYDVALKYSLSKRTFVYGVASRAKFDSEIAGDEKRTLYAVGVNHSF